MADLTAIDVKKNINFLKRIKSKYALYFLCFLALNYIEFLRSTQVGNIWAAAANCTGLVMMVIIFSGLPVKEFLRPMNYVYTLLCILAIGLIYWHWKQHTGEYYFGQMATAVMNIWWIGLVACYLFKQVFVTKTIRLKLGRNSLLWIALTAWTVISVAGRWWPIWFLFMFGSFYLIRYTEEDRRALFRAMIDGTICSFFILQGWACLFRPYDEVRYKGAFSNCNMMALYYLIVYCMALFKLHILKRESGEKIWKCFYFVLAGVLLSLLFMTICRTAWVTAIAVTAAYGWLVVHKIWKERIGKIMLRGIALALCMLLTFPAVYGAVRWLPTIHPHPVWFDGEWNEGKVHSWDPADSEKYVSMDELLETALSKIYGTLRNIGENSPLMLRVQAKTGSGEIVYRKFSGTDYALEGRLNIYLTYLENATWLGHPEEDGHYVMLVESGRWMVWHAQNLFIQILYYFGYPAGVLLLLLAVSLLVSNYKTLIKRSNSVYAVMPFMISLAYFVFGLMEVVWNPGQIILTLVFFVQHPQIALEEEDDEKMGSVKALRCF